MSGSVFQRRSPDPTRQATDEARITQGPDGDREGKRAEQTHEGGGARTRAGGKGIEKGPVCDHSTPPQTETSRAERRGGIDHPMDQEDR